MDDATARINEEFLGSHSLYESRGRLHTNLDELTITSAFQPIFSLAHKKAVGFEGLIRAFDQNDQPVAPYEVFARFDNNERNVADFDRVCRALHVSNAIRYELDAGWLFLNVHSRVVTEGDTCAPLCSQLVEQTGFPPHRIVIEILEDAIPDEDRLAHAVEVIKGFGCLVAIDDFGAGHSNFSRIWRVKPDIVKLDRCIAEQAVEKAEVRRMLPGLVTLLHEAGCLVVLEGIETEEQALIAMQSDIDFVQGFYFSRPTIAAETLDWSPRCLQELSQQFAETAVRERTDCQQILSSTLADMRNCVTSLAGGYSFEEVCQGFIRKHNIACCYLLDRNGAQIGPNLDLRQKKPSDERFAHLANSPGANWARRPYFRRAVAELGRVHISRPYLSVRGAEICITLSMAYTRNEEVYVFCADLHQSEDRRISCSG